MQHITHGESAVGDGWGAGMRSSRGEKGKDETLRKGSRVFEKGKEVIRK